MKKKSKPFFLKIKKFWNYVWNGNDWLSWILSIFFAFIIIKFLFYPAIGFALQTSHPIVAIVSSSMEHKITDSDSSFPNVCGIRQEETKRLNLDEFWAFCGNWYEENNIILDDFKEYPFRRGMNIGDIVFLRNPGADKIKVGDVIVFIQEQNPLLEPIIHRVVAINIENDEIIFQTKGDRNADSINISTSGKYLNEYRVTENQLVGRAILKIPYLGYIKIYFHRLIGGI